MLSARDILQRLLAQWGRYTMRKPTMLPPSVQLANGITIPVLGLGTGGLRDGKEQAFPWAIELGYRHIDTAAVYGNEVFIGRAIHESGIPRSDFFITTKLWNADHGYDSALKAFDMSLERLRTDYVDLYLIHSPLESTKD